MLFGDNAFVDSFYHTLIKKLASVFNSPEANLGLKIDKFTLLKL